uniref:Uncharacterized protein n=1 Tax=Hucho hucho TaxID=62062 RepID=A0A4W5KCK3_9TELE
LPLSFSSIRLDIYRKVPKDLTQPTYTGAVGEVLCCCSGIDLHFSHQSTLISRRQNVSPS